MWRCAWGFDLDFGGSGLISLLIFCLFTLVQWCGEAREDEMTEMDISLSFSWQGQDAHSVFNCRAVMMIVLVAMQNASAACGRCPQG